MADESVHAAAQRIYRSVLVWGDGMRDKALALAREDQAAADRATGMAAEAWQKGISDQIGYLVDIIEVYESAQAERERRGEEIRRQVERIRDAWKADTDHPAFHSVPNREIAALIDLLDVGVMTGY